jgi:gliding motility-associated-like protein
MKKNLLIYLFTFLFYATVFGQTVFQKSLDFALDTTYVRCTPDGKAVFVVGKNNDNGRLRVHFIKISNNGDVLWHKEQSYGNSYALKAVALQTDGIVALIGTTVDAYLVKINSQNGARGFQKYLGGSEKLEFFEAATDDKDNIWLSGLHEGAGSRDSTYYFQMKTDKNAVPRIIRNNVYRTTVGGNEIYAILQYYKPTNMTWHTEGQNMVSVRDIGAKFTHGVSFGFENRRDGAMVSDSNLVFKETGRNYDLAYLQSNAKYILFGAAVVDFPRLGLYGLNKKFTFGLVKSNWSDEVSIRETDDDVMQPVHCFGNDIVFYSPRYKTLTKYDEKMQPLWTKKFDFCSNTTSFSADIASDGSIFTIRKIGNETIISRMNADGNMPTCLSKEDKPVVDYLYRATPNAYRWSTEHGERAFPSFKDTTVAIVEKNSILTPFCVKNNAIFNIPDTVCINTMIKPTDVDTMRGLKHDWTFLPNFADTSMPSINLNVVGNQRVFHRIQFGQCEDSLTKFVYVQPLPIIKLNDTLICGQKNVAINLTDKNAKNYFLNDKPINPIVTIDSSGLYTVKVTSKACTTEKKVKIKINDFTIPTITQVGLPCTNEAYPIVFEKVFKNILWDGKLVNTDTIFVKNSAVHNYALTYKLDSNCVVKGMVQIKRKVCTDVFIPTAFSPNDDQQNDAFEAFPQANFKIKSVSIFDRWGELVFKSTDSTKTWDGKFKGQACGEGVYIYVITYMNIKTSVEETISGDVNLVR